MKTVIHMAAECMLFEELRPDEFEAALVKFAAIVADAEAKRMHDEGMVTVGHMREQIAAEREACAKVCEDEDVAPTDDAVGVQWCIAKAIRARGQA